MNRYFNMAGLVVSALAFIASCQKTPEFITTEVGPEMEIVECSKAALMGDEIAFSVNLADQIPLSTLKAQLYFDDELMSETVIRTKTVGLYEGILDVPFASRVGDGDASLVFVSQNIQFGTTRDTVEVAVSRPDFEYLTLYVDDKSYRMERVAKNQYEYKGSFPSDFEGYMESAPFGDKGKKILFGWKQGAVATGTDAKIPFSTTVSEPVVKLNTLTFEAGPFIIYNISVNGVNATKAADDAGNIYYEYKVIPIEQNASLDVSITVNGEDELSSWYIDPDYVVKGSDGLKFNAVTGNYHVVFDVTYKYVSIQKVKSDGNPASFAEDGILYLLGWGGAYPAMLKQFSWDLGKGWGMAEIRKNVYQFSGTAVPESSVEMGGHFRTDYVDIKYFGNKNSWVPEAGKIFDGSTATQVTLTEASKQWVKLNGTNINLADGKTLEDGAFYVLTVDLSTPGKEIIDFVKK